jgi:hypothetical protein
MVMRLTPPYAKPIANNNPSICRTKALFWGEESADSIISQRQMILVAELNGNNYHPRRIELLALCHCSLRVKNLRGGGAAYLL